MRFLSLLPAILDAGQVNLHREIVEKEGIDNSYVRRMANLRTLAPDIAEAILDDQSPPTLTLFDLAVDPFLKSATYRRYAANTRAIGTDYIAWLPRDHGKIVWPPEE